jgi:hypothetical protein
MLGYDLLEALAQLRIAGGRLDKLQLAGGRVEIVTQEGGVVPIARGVDADADFDWRLGSGL